jgi:hypothetical protein
MDEFKQFKRFVPRFWQEDGIEVAVEVRTYSNSKREPRRSKWLTGLGAIALASVTVVTITIPQVGATRRAAVVDDARAPDVPIEEIISQYTEVPSAHWVNLRDLMRGFARTPEQDRYSDPEPFIWGIRRMPVGWWATKLESRLSQGDVLEQVLIGAPTRPPVFLAKAMIAGKRVVWEEQLHLEPDNDGLGYFLARGRVVPAIVVSHDCTMDNDGKRSRVAVAPMAPISSLSHPDPKYRDAVLRQEQRSQLPLTEVPGLNGDFYADLRLITPIDRRVIDAATRVASMSVEGVERLQHQIADFFVRIDIPADNLALTRKESA